MPTSSPASSPSTALSAPALSPSSTTTGATATTAQRAELCAVCQSPMVPGRQLCRICYSPCHVEVVGAEHRAWLPIELTAPNAAMMMTAVEAEPEFDDAPSAVPAVILAHETGTQELPAVKLPTPATAVNSAAATTDEPASAPPPPAAVEAATAPEAAAETVVGEVGVIVDECPIPEILPDDADDGDGRRKAAVLTLPASKAFRTMMLPSITQGEGLPEPHELPRFVELPIAPIRPTWGERRRASKLGVPAEELAFRKALAMSVGVADPDTLDAPRRAQVRILAAERIGKRLSHEEKKKIIHSTFVEAGVEKFRELERQYEAEMALDRQHRRMWFVAALVAHLMLVLGLWSIILVETDAQRANGPIGMDLDMTPRMPPDMSRLPIPPAMIQAPPLPESDRRRDEPDVLEPEVVRPEPEIPGLNFMPNDLDRREPPRMDNPHRIPDFTLGLRGHSGGDPRASSSTPIPTGGLAMRRTGQGREHALRRHGGNAETENAVNLGLEWLAKQQHTNGSWAPTINESRVGHLYYRPGFTGLALLCFFGAGHTAENGPYQRHVARGIQFILDSQRTSGCFGEPTIVVIYNHTVCLLAVCEAYALTSDRKLREPIERGLRYLYAAQQPSGGWDYTAGKTHDRTDTSITGWAVMAMKSALLGGIDIDKAVWDGAHRAILDMTLPSGEVLYSVNGRVYPNRKGVAMIAVGVLCRLYLRDDTATDTAEADAKPTGPAPGLERSVAWLENNPPSWRKLRTDNSDLGHTPIVDLPSADEFFHSVYYWYYGTLSMFLYTNGSGEAWQKWNDAMQAAVLPNQHRDSTKPDLYGSWDAVHPFWDGPYGRLYATCLNILNLEIYYRYSPLYGGDASAPPGRLVPRETLDSARPPARPPSSSPGRETNREALPSRQSSRFDPVNGDVERAVQLLSDPTASSGDQKRAIDRLKAADTAEGKRTLAVALRNPILTDFIRWEALRALGDMQATDHFRDVVDAYGLAFNAGLRASFLEQVGRLRDAAAFDFLVREMRLQSDAATREAAAKGLSHLTGASLGPIPDAWESWRRNNPHILPQ